MRDIQEVHYVLAQPRRQHPALHVRARRWQFITLAVLLYIPAAIVSLSTLISGSHWWGLVVQPTKNASGAWLVTWSDRGLSTDYNIQTGDLILKANGYVPQSSDEINQADTLEVRSSQATTPHMIQWQAPNQFDNLLSLSWFILGLVSLLLGLLVFLHATDRALALRFFLLWTALAIANSLAPATSFGNLLAVHITGIVYAGIASGLLASFLWRLLLPTSTSVSLRGGNRISSSTRIGRLVRYHWLAEIPVVTGLLFIALYLTAVTLRQQDWLKFAVSLGSVQTILALGLSIFLILSVGLSRRAGVTHERARTLLGGMLLGLTPPLALTVIPELISGQQLVPGTVSDLAIVVLPLAFAYAIVKRDLLRVDSLIRNTTLVLLTVIGIASIAVLLGAILQLLPTQPALVIGISLGALLAPFVLAGARWITEAWLFPQVRIYRRLIAQGEGVERTGLDPQRVAGQLIGEIHLALPVRQVAVFAPHQQSGRLLEISVPKTATKPPEHAAPAPAGKSVVSLADPPSIEPYEPGVLFIDETLSNRLSREGGPLMVEAVPLNRKSDDPRLVRKLQDAATAPADAPDQATPEPPDLESWHLLLPMRVRGRLVAILALSHREDEQSYSDTDLQMLRFLAGRRALALDYALLYADLHMAYERRQELDRLKDQFIVTAHHELRTPLTGVQGYLELLRELGPAGRASRPEEVDLFIERACHAADELNEQLDSLLAAAETNLSQEKLQQRPIELSRVAQRAIQSLDALAQRGHHRIRNTISPDLSALGDEEALYRIFLNLLSNALKYSPDGRPVLFDGRSRLVSANAPGAGKATEAGKHATGMVAVTEVIVRDWGIGISRADQHKIFERFTRLERDLNSPIRGSGLGLAICKELIEAMGGAIWVESDGVSGSGSTFYVRLPQAEATTANRAFSGWEDISIAPDQADQEKSPAWPPFL
jgi:signal transduction histidine kinase